MQTYWNAVVPIVTSLDHFAFIFSHQNLELPNVVLDRLWELQTTYADMSNSIRRLCYLYFLVAGNYVTLKHTVRVPSIHINCTGKISTRNPSGIYDSLRNMWSIGFVLSCCLIVNDLPNTCKYSGQNGIVIYPWLLFLDYLSNKTKHGMFLSRL